MLPPQSKAKNTNHAFSFPLQAYKALGLSTITPSNFFPELIGAAPASTTSFSPKHYHNV